MQNHFTKKSNASAHRMVIFAHTQTDIGGATQLFRIGSIIYSVVITFRLIIVFMLI